MGKQDFKCSNGWLERFKRRHGVSSKSIVGESAAVDRDVVNGWRKHRLSTLLQQYEDRDIYNLDEATFFYKILPKRTYTTPDGTSSGCKQSEERVTVLFEDINDDCEDCDDLYEAVNSIVGGDLEGNFESFAMADADVPVVAPATDAKIVDLLGGPDEEEEPLDKQPREIPTVAQTQEILRLLRNRVECAGGDHDLIICLNKLERALLAPSRSTRQSQLTDFCVRE
ncbi:hypothetical protein HPB52_017085 [Rhipicephalus sanguineus]|uniref:HTH CENPB-type domain-containing protein n=1 Tax=Rhipicephalus sanguineus TaxID=34632 RepID=A0A9D4QFJ6_RHISA|nr:hypothetical protein HPB52_017085 [Rhipicephalus sanguineus]